MHIAQLIMKKTTFQTLAQKRVAYHTSVFYSNQELWLTDNVRRKCLAVSCLVSLEMYGRLCTDIAVLNIFTVFNLLFPTMDTSFFTFSG